MLSKMTKWLVRLLKNNSRWLTLCLSLAVLFIFVFIMTFSNVFTKNYDIERFTLAKESIRSPITIENEPETERKTREISQSVHDRYDISEEITEEQIEYVYEIFEALDKLDETLEEKGHSGQDKSANQKKKKDEISSEDKLNQFKKILSQEITDNMNDSVLMSLIGIPSKERNEGKKVLLRSLEDVFQKGVRTDNLKSATAEVKDTIKYSTLDEALKSGLYAVVDFVIVENSFFDVEKTAEARKEAESNVEPVIIRAGEIIVKEGQMITNEKYEELKLVGLLNKEINVFPIIGLSLLIVLLLFIVVHEILRLNQKNKLDPSKIWSILLISILVIGIMKIISLYMSHTNVLFYVVPVSTGVMLIKHLIDDRLAIVFAIVYSIIGCVIFNGEIPGSFNMEAGIYFLVSQMAAIIFLKNMKDRLAIMKAGLGIAIINIVTVLIFICLSIEKYTFMDLMIQSGMGVASALLSTVLMAGSLPFFETGLNILTDMRLLQLSNPNQPLLKKILTEAPGTYHHSVMVANLSETACEAIGANGLLARVGAYYHDVGKTVKPHYFIENQLAVRNPHDFIGPKKSAAIILRHPIDGANMLNEHKFPKEIVDIALEHHGTTLLSYFYHKEKKLTNSFVDETEFRYAGPKPQTKEAAVVCICDSLEAAVRSLKEPTPQEIENIVSSIVNDRLSDGQLNECPITISELNTVHRTVCETLNGIFHSRIQYPTKESK